MTMDLKKPVALLIVLLVISVLLYLVAGIIALSPRTAGIPAQRGYSQPEAMEADLIRADGKNPVLAITYTNDGFFPADAKVKKGDMVRFTNNSDNMLWVAASDASGTIYPRRTSGCGSSAFDSCGSVERGRYWQFTFDEEGTWSFENNLDKAKKGVIHVN